MVLGELEVFIISFGVWHSLDDTEKWTNQFAAICSFSVDCDFDMIISLLSRKSCPTYHAPLPCTPMQMSSVLRAPVDNGIYSATRESSHESTGEGLRAVISKVFE